MKKEEKGANHHEALRWFLTPVIVVAGLAIILAARASGIIADSPHLKDALTNLPQQNLNLDVILSVISRLFGR